MRKNRVLIVVIFCCLIFLVGCNEKELDYLNIYRDDFCTGGDLTFMYDKTSQTAYFGGPNEVVAYYEENIVKGWKEGGNRVGIKLYIPKEVTSYQSVYAYIDNQKYEDFYVFVNEEKPSFAQFFPVVSENNRELELKINWGDGFKEQIYHIVIMDGTIFEKDK